MPLQKDVSNFSYGSRAEVLTISFIGKLEPPMSDWFCALPYKIDSIAQAAKVRSHEMWGVFMIDLCPFHSSNKKSLAHHFGISRTSVANIVKYVTV